MPLENLNPYQKLSFLAMLTSIQQVYVNPLLEVRKESNKKAVRIEVRSSEVFTQLARNNILIEENEDCYGYKGILLRALFEVYSPTLKDYLLGYADSVVILDDSNPEEPRELVHFTTQEIES